MIARHLQSVLLTACRSRCLPPRTATGVVLGRRVACAQSLHRSMAASTTWSGAQASQEDFMQMDQCIVVDESDNVLGHNSKFNCHKFIPGQEQGILHRAFSVFLFDNQNRLLLQQRASSKITFPSVWTNTCCSHQLHRQTPPELDEPQQILDGSVPGAKHAAVRKLEHELGIPSSQLPLDRFKFLTRLHYCAADKDTHGPNAEWGEHEMDFILFIKADVTLKPNPDEVDAVKYVTLPELQAMMAPGSGLSWSPWFRIIASRFLPAWWEDLDVTLNTDKHVDASTIHHINP